MKKYFIYLYVSIASFCAQADSSSNWQNVNTENLKAEIRRTSYGVPHIKADSYLSLGFGQAYAFAEDNVCMLAEQITKVRSERSLFFGPGENNANIVSDFSYKALQVYPQALKNFSKMSEDAQSLVVGYALGFNKFLRTRELPSECRGQAYVREISPYDLLAYYISVSMMTSGEALAPAILNASPIQAEKGNNSIDFDAPESVASNAWAFGSHMTKEQNGVLLANPHFPAFGPLKFYQFHLTIPGELDVQGGSLYGVPLVQIGYNKDLGWTHTVATSKHFSVYKLKLLDGDPLKYEYRNRETGLKEVREIQKKTFSIKVNLGTPEPHEIQRDVYYSHYGPMIEIPNSPMLWGEGNAYSFRDANTNNTAFLDQWLQMGKAKNLSEFKKALMQYQGLPWVNTIYADRDGNAFYTDATRVPQLSPAAMNQFLRDKRSQLIFANMGIIMLDGSDSLFEWQGENGLVPFSKAPKLQTKKYVSNHNDSPWLTSALEPISGYSPFYGDFEIEPSPRTKMGLTMIKELQTRGDIVAADIEEALFSNRSFYGENLLADLLLSCPHDVTLEMEEGEEILVHTYKACEILQGWDLKLNLESHGVAIFREWMSLISYDKAFIGSFRPETPLAIRRVNYDYFYEALAKAQYLLSNLGLFDDRPLGDIQYFPSGELNIPYHGGIGATGAFNIMGYRPEPRSLISKKPDVEILNPKSGLTQNGYPITYGTSFVFVVSFDEEGPEAHGLLTYSQSSHKDSPHHIDQNLLYHQKKLRKFLFTEEEIKSDLNYQTKEVVY